jgi:hypothetical protein
MSRSFRDLLKFSAPALLSAAMLSGCGSGSSGSANLDQGPSVVSPPPPVTVTETFNFTATADYFVVGTPPIHARFAGGEAQGNGAWIIRSGQTGVVDFGTPADAVKFSTKDNYTAAVAAAGAGAQKGTLLPRGSQKVDAPFDTALYIRGSIRDDWAQPPPENQLRKSRTTSSQSPSRSMPGDYQFKVADVGWTGATNCGGSPNPRPFTLGGTLGCSNSSAEPDDHHPDDG